MPLSNRDFREKMGFTNQAVIKKYFKFTDEVIVNWDRIEQGNERLKEIFTRLNFVVHEDIRPDNIETFLDDIDATYLLLKNNDIIPRLNNFGRTPDDVFYN